ncbi:MAG: AAA family ATPase [bacterium]|nr:AAA family ATPase [bacterium]
MYVHTVDIRELRCFREASLDICVPTGRASRSGPLSNVTLLLGDNGVGKTTVLKAIALATLAPVMASGSGFVPYSLVRRTRSGAAKLASVRAELAFHAQDGVEGPESAELHLRPTRGFTDRLDGSKLPEWAEAMYDDESPAFFMVGYGATRRVETGMVSEGARQKSRMLRYQRVAGLFEEHVALMPLAAWLPQWGERNPGRHKQVVSLMNRLLPTGECRMLPEPQDDDYIFEMRGARVPFGALSDGYRAYVGWVADLLHHVCVGCPSGAKLVDCRGVVLIDEVDLHLHPSWQQRVVPTLSRVLRNLQFVLTSHSPLVAGTLHSENVRVLRRDGDATVIDRVREDLYGRSADQILTGEHFGLTSARPPSVNELVRTLAARARSGDPEAALRFMDVMAHGAEAAERSPAAQEADAASE